MMHESSTTQPAFFPTEDTPRKPRIALMGEFSAGKSTLANLMIGTDPLPMQVVATQLPPVWISHGTGDSAIVDLEGRERVCNIQDLRDLDPEDVAYIRIWCEEDILTMCDIIDMPGISDPNMSTAVWERLLPLVDGVIWCSPSTQAWRQSEAAVWDSIDSGLYGSSILLLTRSDMLLTEKDCSKVFKRVRNETEGLFAHTQMISLLQARDAGDDEAIWHACGADAFVRHFLEILDRLNQTINGAAGPIAQNYLPVAAEEDASSSSGAADVVVPRRPSVKSSKKVAPEESKATDQDPKTYAPKFS